MPPTDHPFAGGLLVALDRAGTFVFALSGAAAGVRHRVDLFGVLVLSFAAATAGGITRDVLIGAIPPPAIFDGRYVSVSLLAGLVTFFWHPVTDRLKSFVLVFDALGLALFAISGTLKALAFGLGPIGAVLLGVVTAIGGGIARDVLVSEVPAVMRSELYAIAALAGSIVVVAGDALHVPSPVAIVGGAILCFGLRLMGIRRDWRLPVARDRPGSS